MRTYRDWFERALATSSDVVRNDAWKAFCLMDVRAIQRDALEAMRRRYYELVSDYLDDGRDSPGILEIDIDEMMEGK